MKLGYIAMTVMIVSRRWWTDEGITMTIDEVISNKL
jgi:hypothetical protein